MRRLRRFSAVVLQLLVAQLGIAGGASACPMRGEAAAVALNAAAHHTGGHAGRGVAGPASASHAGASSHHRHHGGVKCDMACTPNCATGTHCAGAAVTRGAGADIAFWLTGHAPDRGADTPLSVGTGPEPPPPRA